MTKSKGLRKPMVLRLSAELHDLLTEFSDLTGTSRHDYIVGILEEAKPHIRTLISIAKQAHDGTANPYVMLKKLLEDTSGMVTKASFDAGAASAQKKAPRKRKTGNG